MSLKFIYAAAKYNQYDGISGRNILIITDEKAAISPFKKVFITPRIVKEYRTFLLEMARHSMVTLKWVSGHRGILDNCMTDSLVHEGSTKIIQYVIKALLFSRSKQTQTSSYR